MGMMAGRQLTREEALLILGVPEGEEIKNEDGNRVETLDPEFIMSRFDTLIEKNQVDKGGSFYV